MVQKVQQEAAIARLPAPLYATELVDQIADLIGCAPGVARGELRRSLEAAGRDYLRVSQQTIKGPDPELARLNEMSRLLLAALDQLPGRQLERLYEAAQQLEDRTVRDGKGVLVEIGAAKPYEEDGDRGLEFLGLDDLPPLLGLLTVAIGRVQAEDCAAKVDLRRLNAWARQVTAILKGAGARSCPVIGLDEGGEPALRQILLELLRPLHPEAVSKLESALDRRWP